MRAAIECPPNVTHHSAMDGYPLVITERGIRSGSNLPRIRQPHHDTIGASGNSIRDMASPPRGQPMHDRARRRAESGGESSRLMGEIVRHSFVTPHNPLILANLGSGPKTQVPHSVRPHYCGGRY